MSTESVPEVCVVCGDQPDTADHFITVTTRLSRSRESVTEFIFGYSLNIIIGVERVSSVDGRSLCRSCFDIVLKCDEEETYAEHGVSELAGRAVSYIVRKGPTAVDEDDKDPALEQVSRDLVTFKSFLHVE